MFKQLGNIIEKRPLLVIIFILLITIGFGILIPGLDFKTDFKDFMPEEEIVDAYMRVTETFGQSQQIMFLYLNKEDSDSVLAVDALKEQNYIESELEKLPEIDEALSIITLIDQFCLLEFGNSFENCSDSQIQTVVQDILADDVPTSIKVFDSDDPNEKVDYNRYPRISRGRSINEIDIQNCYVSFDEEKMAFSFQVYDLSKFESKLKSPIPFINIVEWYLDFKNIVQPDPLLDIDYRIAVHIEPTHNIWEFGKGLIENVKDIFNHIRNRELLNSYKTEAYLWIKPPGQDLYFPLPLKTDNIIFDVNENIINLTVSKQELGDYGISIRYGFFELPAKLTNFKAGTRYYQSPIGKLSWLKFSANTSFIFNRINKLKNRPILGPISERFLKRFTNITWQDFDQIYESVELGISLPSKIALKDIDESWINADRSPDRGKSDNLLFIRTQLFDELKVNVLSFVSKDYEKSNKPSAGIIILPLNTSWNYDQSLKITDNIVNRINELDNVYDFVSVETTGDTVISYQLNEVTMEANQIIIPLIFVIIILVLFIFFRKASYMLLPLLALVVSVIWLFGTMVLLNITFTTMSVVIVPLLLGLGVDYSVHLSHNYRLEISNGRTPAEAIKKSILEIGTAMFLAMITTVIAFMSFLTATIMPLRDLGLLLGLGILYTFITAITLQAAIRYYIDRKKKKFDVLTKESFRLNKIMGKLAQAVLGHQKLILVTLILVTIFAGIGAVQIETGFDLNSFLPEDNQAIQILGELEDKFPSVSQYQEYILLEGDVSDTRTLKGIKQTYENLRDDTFVAKNVDDSPRAESIYTIITLAVKNNQSLINEFNLDENTYIPNNDRDVKRLYDYLWDSFEFGMQTQLLLQKDEFNNYNAAVMRIYVNIQTANKGGAALDEDLAVLDEELHEDLAEFGDVDVTITGYWSITHEITSSLTDSQILSTGVSLVLATIVLIIAYRRLTLGIIAMVPVIISIVWILGTMFFIGYNLNVLTISVTSLTIGIGVDYAIHATERFRLVADKTGSITAALTETISKTGGALLIAALTTTLGFGMLIFAPMPPQVQFGIIMILTISFAFITSVLLLPLILARWGNWSRKKKGYIISTKPADEEYLNNSSSKKK